MRHWQRHAPASVLHSHPLSGRMKVQSQLQSLLPLVGADGELLPDPVESGQGVSR